MSKWNNEYRAITTTLISNIEQLYLNSRASSNTHPAYSKVLASLSDWFQLQSQVSGELELALRSERAWRKKLEKRVQNLEAHITANQNENGQENKECIQLNSKEDDKIELQTTMKVTHAEKGKVNHESESNAVSIDNNEQHKNVKKHSELKNLADSPVPCEASQSRKRPRIDTISKTVAPVIEEKMNAQLPSLPTVSQVQNDIEQRRKKRKEIQNRQLLPCAKCRLRKRAIMLRKDAYIKENVFERWASKPGNCIEYIHMDEPLPPSQCKNSLSFSETPTQSPNLDVEAGG